jgi:hypothetical protein
MQRRADIGLVWVLAGSLALIALPQVARAADSPWASRAGSYLAQPGDPLDWYQRRAMGYRSSLEIHWEKQQLAQQVSTHDRPHAWFGNHGGYYTSQFSRPTGPFSQGDHTYPAAYSRCRSNDPGDLCFGDECDLLDLINYSDLCGNHSPIDCLEGLHRSGRR